MSAYYTVGKNLAQCDKQVSRWDSSVRQAPRAETHPLVKTLSSELEAIISFCDLAKRSYCFTSFRLRRRPYSGVSRCFRMVREPW